MTKSANYASGQNQGGWKYMKMKVGANQQDDIRRTGIIREEIGYDMKLVTNTNQNRDVSAKPITISKHPEKQCHVNRRTYAEP
jgi:L-alanine-DL-glutamate epimerase-like enolase superfamily enzyme